MDKRLFSKKIYSILQNIENYSMHLQSNLLWEIILKVPKVSKAAGLSRITTTF